MSREEVEYDDRYSIEHDGFDSSLVITLWGEGVEVDRRVRIPVDQIPDFVRQVTSHGMYALSDAARRLEVGHCETCGNTGLVNVEKNGKPWSVNCPDCRDRWPDNPFQNAPQIGRRNS